MLEILFISASSRESTFITDGLG